MLIPIGPIISVRRENDDIGQIIKLSISQSKLFFITLSPKHFSLWRTEPLLPICINERDDEAVVVFGLNYDVEWNDNSSMICVATDKCWLYLYRITENNSTTHVNDIYIEQISLFKTSMKTTCLANYGNFFLVATNDCILEAVRWPTKNSCHLHRFKIDIHKHRAKSDTCDDNIDTSCYEYPNIIFINPTKWGGIVCLLSNGQVIIIELFNANSTCDIVQSCHNTNCLILDNVAPSSCIAVNDILESITVYEKSGLIKGYIFDSSTKTYEPKYTYPVNKPNINFSDNFDDIIILKWSPDFNTLAVSKKKCYLAIFTQCGSCISYFDFTKFERANLLDISSMCWGLDGYSLIVVSTNKIIQSNIYIINFFKLLNNRRHRIILHNRNTIYLPQSEERFNIDDNTLDFTKPAYFDPLNDLEQWYKIFIENENLRIIKKIKSISVNESKLKIAILGEMGLLIYDIINQCIIKSISITNLHIHLLWYKHWILFTTVDSDEIYRNYIPPQTICFFDSHNAAINNSRVHRFTCKSSYLYISSIDIHHDLIFIVNDTHAEIYMINDCGGQLSISKRCCVNVSFPKPLIQYIYLSSEKTLQHQRIHIFVLYDNDLLFCDCSDIFQLYQDTSCSSLEITSFEFMKITGSVEKFWLAPSSAIGDSPLGRFVFIYCYSQCLKIFLLNDLTDGCNTVSSHSGFRFLFELPLLTYPYMIMVKKMIIRAISIEIYYKESYNNFSNFEVNHEITNSLILPDLLIGLIENNEQPNSRVLCQMVETSPHFLAHNLEIALHKSFQVLPTTCSSDPCSIFFKMFTFIKQFENSFKIICHFIRKEESSKWPRIFEFMPSPSNMCNECLSQNQIETASSFLIIVQCLESPKKSQLLAIEILDRAISNKLWNIVADLQRYIKSLSSLAKTYIENSSPTRNNLFDATTNSIFPYFIFPSKTSQNNLETDSGGSKQMNDIIEIKLNHFLNEHINRLYITRKFKDLGFLIHYSSYDFSTFKPPNWIMDSASLDETFDNLIEDFKFISNQSMFLNSPGTFSSSTLAIQSDKDNSIESEIQIIIERKQISVLQKYFYDRYYLKDWIILNLFIMDFQSIENVLFITKHFEESEQYIIEHVCFIIMHFHHSRKCYSEHQIVHACSIIKKWLITTDVNWASFDQLNIISSKDLALFIEEHAQKSILAR